MQLKFSKQYTTRQKITNKLSKLLIILALISFAIFLIDKIKLPSPKQEINQNITDEIIKLK
tara:strand:- start:801 stop:983 length:183 start_codon:yes stop_codon:yes gene_type:complete